MDIKINLGKQLISHKMRIVFYFVLSLHSICLSAYNSDKKTITLESLLDEMISLEESTRLPDPYYTAHQKSSYDRLSVSPDSINWFANADGFGIIRTDTIGDRVEKVMFDESGPGVITRIWITTIDKRGIWRFYFDGADTPDLIIPAYDLMQIGISALGRGLLQAHTSYTSEGKGGNTMFLPIPYTKACKITFEDETGIAPTPKYYHINYRKYNEGTKIETFSKEVVKRAEQKIKTIDNILLSPKVKKGVILTADQTIEPNDSLVINLPEGENAIYEIRFNTDIADSLQFAQLMHELIFCAEFDGKQTVWVPLSDYSGGGMGAPHVESYYLSSDGKGNISSRWMMPYKKNGTIKLINASETDIKASLHVNTSPLKWDNRSLYFHASWRQETGIYIHDKPEEDDNCIEWNFATIEGKGIYKGDLLSLFNHAPAWYGEGDEKIWVDNDTFPSHFGTGTEDYYNSSWAPIIPFQTPFGGAPRADLESSHGYNAFFRTRNLDVIPFSKKFRFDIEMIGWVRGYVDYATTIYWYGDYNSHAIGLSGANEARKKLHKAPENPAKYRIENSIEFEDIIITDNPSSIRTERQTTYGFPDGKWSEAAQLLCIDGKSGESIEFELNNLPENKYQLIVYATSAPDYGIISFTVNDVETNVSFDAYSSKVINSEPIKLGCFHPEIGKIKLKIKIIGSNSKSQGTKYMFGLDCIQLIPTL